MAADPRFTIHYALFSTMGKALKKAGGPKLSKYKPLPDGYHILQASRYSNRNGRFWGST